MARWKTLVSGHDDVYIRRSTYSYPEVIDFCTESGRRPQPGIQFDGSAASSAVMAMEPGEYNCLSEGRLLLFPEGEFMLKFSEAKEKTGPTDGPDLYNTVGIIGCSREQLSEAALKNELSVDLFELTRLYDYE